MEDVAGKLKDEVVSAFKNTDAMPWPLLASDLSASNDRVIPSQQKMFLISLFLRKEMTENHKSGFFDWSTLLDKTFTVQ